MENKCLIDIGGMDCDCSNDVLEYLGKSLSQNNYEDLWTPHENSFIADVIELFTKRGLLRSDTVTKALLDFISGASYTGRKFKGDLPDLVYRWNKDELRLIKLYLESLKPNGWELQDYDILTQYLYQRYFPMNELRNEAEWLSVRSHLMGRAKTSLYNINTRQAAILAGALPVTVKAAIKIFNIEGTEKLALEYAKLKAADLIVSLSDQSRHAVKMTLLDHFQKKMSGDETATTQKLEQSLFDAHMELNRDWRRIALTEAGNGFNEGFVASLPPGTHVKRVELYNCCGYCKSIDGKVMTVCDSNDPEKDGDTMIWQGKNNVGRSSSPNKRMPDGTLVPRTKEELWWVTTGTIHPNCRGFFIQVAENYRVSDKFAAWFEKESKKPEYQ